MARPLSKETAKLREALEAINGTVWHKDQGFNRLFKAMLALHAKSRNPETAAKVQRMVLRHANT